MKITTTILCLVMIANIELVCIAKQQMSNSDAIYTRFEEYDRKMSSEQIRERLDGLAQHLEVNPSFQVHLVSYGGRKSCRNEALLRARLASDYLSKRGLNSNRIKIFDGGYRANWVVELWVGTPAAIPPPRTRTIDKRRVGIERNCRFTPIAD